MQEDIAGIGQHQGRHGKYATFYAGGKCRKISGARHWSERQCPVTVHDGAALYLCIMEKYCGFGKRTAMQEATRKFSHRSW